MQILVTRGANAWRGIVRRLDGVAWFGSIVTAQADALIEACTSTLIQDERRLAALIQRSVQADLIVALSQRNKEFCNTICQKPTFSHVLD